MLTVDPSTYVDEATAQSDGLISSTSASFRMGADSTTTLSPT